MSATPELSPDSTMQEILSAFPGAKRALFARYHIGGCSSCAYGDDESLSSVCHRNDDLPIDEVMTHILNAHEHDKKLLISPKRAEERCAANRDLLLLDIRTAEEYDAVRISGSTRYTEQTLQEISATGTPDREIIVYDHLGKSALDIASFIMGHGFTNVSAIEGGIDRYSQEVDNSLPRYRLEFE